MIKAVLIICVVFSCTNYIILESYQTHISKPVITSEKISYKQGEDVVILGWVNYNNEATSDVLLRIIATNPSEIVVFDEYVVSDIDGMFSTEIPIPRNAEVGSYDIEIISQCREIHREVCTHQYESLSITVEEGPNHNQKIPVWVKNIFVWYAQEKVTEEELLGAIEFLVNQNIIQIKNSNS